MELVHAYQVHHQEINAERIDYYIAASGYQHRCTYLAQSTNLAGANKLLISFDEPDFKEVREKNEQWFHKAGFQSIKTSVQRGTEIESMLQSICLHKPCKSLNILIDYSCMPRLWYATILDFLIRNEFDAERINIFLSYTPKKTNFSPVKSEFKEATRLMPCNSIKQATGNLSLITGINSEISPGEDLMKEFKPKNAYAFVPDFMHDQSYYSGLVQVHKPFLEKLPTGQVLKYPANRPDQISSMLTSLCLDLRLKSEVVLVPHGPKTLALSALLLSLKYPDIKVLELKTNCKAQGNEMGEAGGVPIITKTVFCTEEEADDY